MPSSSIIRVYFSSGKKFDFKGEWWEIFARWFGKQFYEDGNATGITDLLLCVY